MAAFALGLIGDAAAVEPLVAALADADARVQGRAAEGLGLIGHATGRRRGRPDGRRPRRAPARSRASTPTISATRWRRPSRRCGSGSTRWCGSATSTALRAAVLDADGHPVSDWWPLAFALQRIGHADALPALRIWLDARWRPRPGPSRCKGLGAPQGRRVAAGARSAGRPTPASRSGVRVQSMRAPRRHRRPRARPQRADGRCCPAATAGRAAPRGRRGASARSADRRWPRLLVDYLEDAWPPMRAAAQAAMARSDAETFMPVLSGLDNDPRVERARRAGDDAGRRSARAGRRRGSVQLARRPRSPRSSPRRCGRWRALKLPRRRERLLAALARRRISAVRMAAAQGLGELKPPGAAEALARRSRRRAADTHLRRRAPPCSRRSPRSRARRRRRCSTARWPMPSGRSACARRRCCARSAPVAGAEPARPAPPPRRAGARGHRGDGRAAGTRRTPTCRRARARFASSWPCSTRRARSPTSCRWSRARLLQRRCGSTASCRTSSCRPATRAATAKAARATRSATSSTCGRILRGTVGMALDWKDTGGSQFFITLSPQPHLDARYTVFGQVSTGWRWWIGCEPWDAIESVRVWDGTAVDRRRAASTRLAVRRTAARDRRYKKKGGTRCPLDLSVAEERPTASWRSSWRPSSRPSLPSLPCDYPPLQVDVCGMGDRATALASAAWHSAPLCRTPPPRVRVVADARDLVGERKDGAV